MLKPKGKITENEVKKFLHECWPSADSNPDGWGAMWEAGYVKSPDTFKISDTNKILEKYKTSRFFGFHVRRATSPVNYENAHPFDMKEFRGVHNGVVRVPDYKLGVDSLEMFQKIKDTTGAEFKDRIIKGMKRISGTYSVLIHSGDKLYYYRNSPSFGFMLAKHRNKNMIYGATDISRLERLAQLEYGMFPICKTATPQSGKLYSIDLNSGKFVVEGEIKDEPIVYYSYKGNKQKTIDYDNLAPRRGWQGYDSDSYSWG